ncbi:hypothetical protein QJQ45_021989 [Haematococcus lacustris]|nr:hypothetical protein QJQ45_021989 [Haematococcus lacustris]
MQLTSSLAHLTNGLVKRNNHSLATPRQPALKMCGIGQAAKYGPARLSVAPMMDWTDVHYRFLWFPPEQRPLVCQLGGSDPATLAAATALAVQYGYDEINLNCGCPSDRVAGAGCFGAALMLQPHLVADCMAAMAAAAQGTPVSVKCRLGVDQVDSYAAVHEFVRVVSSTAPVTHFIIHARKCFLKAGGCRAFPSSSMNCNTLHGTIIITVVFTFTIIIITTGLNPHQNRTVPPLRYSWVYGLKRDFPHLRFSLNGGIQGCYEARAYLDLIEPPAAHQQQAHTPAGTAPAQVLQGPTQDTLPDQLGQQQGQQQEQQQGQQQGQQGVPALHQTQQQQQDQKEDEMQGPDQQLGEAAAAAAQQDTMHHTLRQQQQPGHIQLGLEQQQPENGSSTTTTTTTSTSLQGQPSELRQQQQQQEQQQQQQQQQQQAGLGLEGVMIGRQAYNDPWGVLADADMAVFGAASNPCSCRRQVLKDYCAYTDRVTQHFSDQEGGSKAAAVRMMMKPLLNLFHGEKGSKRWKAEVDTVLKGNPSSLAAVLDQTLHWLPDEVLDAPPRRGPCADSALHGLSSATPGPDQWLLGPLPSMHHRAGIAQAPGAQDIKRPKLIPPSQTQPAADQPGPSSLLPDSATVEQQEASESAAGVEWEGGDREVQVEQIGEYQQGYKRLNDRLPKVKQRLHRVAEFRWGIDGRARNNA